MRLIFKLIVVVLALDFIAGIAIIIMKIMSRPKPEYRYTFKSFQDDSKHGYVMDDDNGNHVFYAVKAGEKDKRAIYKFTDVKKQKSSKHTISGLGNNDNAPNFTNASFLFDDTDIWEYLNKMGVDLQTTMVDDSLTSYRIKKGSEIVALATKRRDENDENSYVYKLRTFEKETNYFFLSLFALARTEKNGIRSKQNVKIRKNKKSDEKDESSPQTAEKENNSSEVN